MSLYVERVLHERIGNHELKIGKRRKQFIQPSSPPARLRLSSHRLFFSHLKSDFKAFSRLKNLLRFSDHIISTQNLSTYRLFYRYLQFFRVRFQSYLRPAFLRPFSPQLFPQIFLQTFLFQLLAPLRRRCLLFSLLLVLWRLKIKYWHLLIIEKYK